MLNLKFKKWVIMDKGRTVIAKGVPRNRQLIPLSDTEDQQRILDYTTKSRAVTGFTGCGFWNNHDPDNDGKHYELEAVPVEITIKEMKDNNWKGKTFITVLKEKGWK